MQTDNTNAGIPAISLSDMGTVTLAPDGTFLGRAPLTPAEEEAAWDEHARLHPDHAPATFGEATCLLAATRRLLAAALRTPAEARVIFNDMVRGLNEHIERLLADIGNVLAERDALTNCIASHEAADKAWQQRITIAARTHAREVIWSRMNTERRVPTTWTAAHPPDDLTAQVLATALGDDGFAAYSEAFRAAWAEQVEAIADEREVKHWSGRVKI